MILLGFLMIFSATLIPNKFYLKAFTSVNSIISPGTDLKQSSFYRVFSEFDRYFRPFDLLKRTISGVFSRPEILKIHIKYVDYQTLGYRVYLARKRGRINAEDKAVVVNARLNYKDEIYRAKIRLRGQFMDHIKSNKWSFRIKLKDNKTIWGMNRFSIQTPETRRFSFEWLYQEVNRYLGLMALRYKFAQVHLNGKNLGIYGIEEFFDKRLVESNNRRAGLLVRPLGNELHVFQKQKVNLNPESKASFEIIKQIYKQYKSLQLPVSKIYDLEKTAKHIALSELFGAFHGHIDYNYVCYYNPITARLEPIPYDGNITWLLKDRGLLIEKRQLMYFKNMAALNHLFPDPKFFKLYLKYLVNYSKPGFFDEFFKQKQAQWEEIMSVLYKEYPYRDFSRLDWFHENQAYIRKYLASYFDINKTLTDETVYTFMKAHEIEILKIGYDKKFISKHDLILQKDQNQKAFHFLKTDNKKRIIAFRRGSWKLKKDLIIPKGYTLEMGPGTELKLNNSASIISYSPIKFIGSKEEPIKISSNSKIKSGIMVLNTNGVSLLKNTLFTSLSSPNRTGLNITGAVSFYEADVNIEDCSFSNNHNSDDILNIIRSKFLISNSSFTNTFADAVDVDFGKGKIVKSKFKDINNDGLDFSGSAAAGTELELTNIKDKAISVGEKSSIDLNSIKINKAKIGISGKDLSVVKLNNIQIKNSKYGLAIFQKKPEYGPARVIAKNIEFQGIDEKYLLEKKSKLKIDEMAIEANSEELSSKFY